MKLNPSAWLVLGLAAIIPTVIAVTSILTLPQPHPGEVKGSITGPLTWSPPAGWESYQRVSVEQAPELMRVWSGGQCTALNNNLIIELPVGQPYYGPLDLDGGGNIVIIGGEIQIPWQGDGASISARRAIKIQDCAVQPFRIVHIEGVKIGIDDINANCTSGTGVRTNFDPGCSDLSEGIQIAAPNSIVQLQNIRINHIHARDQSGHSDNHPDLIQTWGGYGELRMDRFTGHTDYQGLFLKIDNGRVPGGAHLKNINIIGDPTATQLFWSHYTPGASGVTLEGFWIQPPVGNSFNYSVFPNSFAVPPDIPVTMGTDAFGQEYATWAWARTPIIVGAVYKGIPGFGDFVPSHIPGIGYVSPGYAVAVAAPQPPPPPPAEPPPPPPVAPPVAPAPPPVAPPPLSEEEDPGPPQDIFSGGATGLQQLLQTIIAQTPQAPEQSFEAGVQDTAVASGDSAQLPQVLGAEQTPVPAQVESMAQLQLVCLTLLALLALIIGSVALRHYQTKRAGPSAPRH